MRECTTLNKENLDNVWVTMGTEGLRMLMCELARVVDPGEFQKVENFMPRIDGITSQVV